MMRFWFAAIFLVQSQIPVQQVQPGAARVEDFHKTGVVLALPPPRRGRTVPVTTLSGVAPSTQSCTPSPQG